MEEILYKLEKEHGYIHDSVVYQLIEEHINLRRLIRKADNLAKENIGVKYHIRQSDTTLFLHSFFYPDINSETTIDLSDLIGSYDPKEIKAAIKQLSKRLKLAEKNPVGCRITKNGVEPRGS